MMPWTMPFISPPSSFSVPDGRRLIAACCNQRPRQRQRELVLPEECDASTWRWTSPMALPWKGWYSSCSEWRAHPQVLPDHWPGCVAPRAVRRQRAPVRDSRLDGRLRPLASGLSKLAAAVYAAVGKAGSEILPARGAPPPGMMGGVRPRRVAWRPRTGAAVPASRSRVPRCTRWRRRRLRFEHRAPSARGRGSSPVCICSQPARPSSSSSSGVAGLVEVEQPRSGRARARPRRR